MFCEGVRVVISDEAPLGGVAQVILHGVRVVEVSLQVKEHEEREKEKDGEVQVEVERDVEENQGETLIMDGMEMTVKDSKNSSQEDHDTSSTRRTTTKQHAAVLTRAGRARRACSCDSH